MPSCVLFLANTMASLGLILTSTMASFSFLTSTMASFDLSCVIPTRRLCLIGILIRLL